MFSIGLVWNRRAIDVVRMRLRLGVRSHMP